MKTVIHPRIDGGVSYLILIPEVLAVMTGDGAGWSDERIEYEIFKNPGREAILRPFMEAYGRGGVTEDEAIETLRIKNEIATCVGCQVGDIELPDELQFRDKAPTFRNEWTWDSTKVVVDMAKARVTHMDRIRRMRNGELAKLDVEYMRAQESGDTSLQQRVAAQKQALRDLPQTFKLGSYRSAKTLKAAWPDGLPELPF